MSEIVTTPPGGIFPSFGLQVISNGPVTLRNPPTSDPGTVEAIGSSRNDQIFPTADGSHRFRFLIDGKSGNDTITGGSLSDTLKGGSGRDTIRGGAGSDSIEGGSGSDLIFGGSGRDTIRGGAGNDTIEGGAGADSIRAGSGNDLVYGGPGNDFIDGGAGRDSLYGDAGNDTISGGSGSDFINGAGGRDLLSGGAGNDTITAGTGDDTVDGGSGNDLLFASQGTDVLTGGRGRDTFLIGSSATPVDYDVITDFKPSDDSIFLDRSVLGNSLPLGNIDSSQFASVDTITGSSTGAAIVYEKSTGFLYFNPGSGADVKLLKLGTNLDITYKDFKIVSA